MVRSALELGKALRGSAPPDSRDQIRETHEVRLDVLDAVREQLVRLLVADAGVHNYLAALLPVHGLDRQQIAASTVRTVVTRFLSPVCSESMQRRISLNWRPVEAGYCRMRRIVFFGSMMKTEVDESAEATSSDDVSNGERDALGVDVRQVLLVCAVSRAIERVDGPSMS